VRRAAHVDGNHHAVVAELRRNGIAVLSLAAVGKGCPDLLCAFRDVTVLLELKNPEAERGPAQAMKLTVQETEFIANWPGKVYVVTSPEEAVRVVVEAARPSQKSREAGEAEA
jgi:Holliday junction resolvase